MSKPIIPAILCLAAAGLALVPGWRVILRVGDATYDDHAASNGHLLLCPRERATDPIADQST
jgi:hypothetical protein